MTILLKNVIIVDTSSPYHLQKKDIFIDKGIVSKIDSDILNENVKTINCDDAYISNGWIDIFSDFSDPGHEYRETLESGADAAFAGGFTKVFVIPNTQPTIDNKAQINYIIEKSKSLPVQIFPLGAVSQKTEGKDLAEMYDIRNAGAIAFSDGKNPIQSSGLFLKALQYVKAFNGILIQQPIDASVAAHGLINEGIISTQLGLPGLSAIAEELMIMRDIELLRYTESRLHITGISTAKSVALIAAAKKEGLDITCSVAPYQLFFTDEDLKSYDANLKVNPPLRTKADQDALKKGIKDGTIDAIASHHFPLHSDEKEVEFEYAKNGMIGLQTAYSLVCSALPNISVERINELFYSNVANIFGLNNEPIKENMQANFTIFQPNEKTVFTKENNKSKSNNSSLFNKELRGKIIATISKNKIFIHQ